jgi:GNAT superfamily N-acetyltransferase
LIRNFRYGLMTKTLLDRLASKGIDIRLMYWTKEELDDVPMPEFKDNLEEYSFGFLEPEEMKTILEEEQKGESLETWISWLEEGKKCFGAKHRGRVVAFCWVFFEYSTHGDKIRIKDDEVFLFYLFTKKAYRGKNIAPLIHFKLYGVLEEMGREACYSWTEFFNPPAKKFKKKLNAKFVKLILYIELFKKYKWSRTVKNYKL